MPSWLATSDLEIKSATNRHATLRSFCWPSLRQGKLLCTQSKAASVGVRDLSLTVARLALKRIDPTAWLQWLLHDWVARSIAGEARVLFDLWRHAEP